MEKELNIAAILKDKPKGTKLYLAMIGECFLKELQSSLYPIFVYTKNRGTWHFLKDGKFEEEGECMLFPSKSMRSWSKFAWKKGDVLVNKSYHYCFFDSWANNNYTKFNAKFIDDSYSNDEVDTKNWNKCIDEKESQDYIKRVNHIVGKIDLKTLNKIDEKPKLKDGDIIAIEESVINKKVILIYKGMEDKENILCATFYIPSDDYVNIRSDRYFVKNRVLRLATDSEKRQLFDALAKERKRWNSETKTLENLSKKFKALDYILIKDIFRTWQLHQYAFDNKYSIITVGGVTYSKQCKILPYNDQTAHLLGTTDDWKGGE